MSAVTHTDGAAADACGEAIDDAVVAAAAAAAAAKVAAVTGAVPTTTTTTTTATATATATMSSKTASDDAHDDSEHATTAAATAAATTTAGATADPLDDAAAAARVDADDAAAEGALCATQQQHVADAKTHEALRSCSYRILHLPGRRALRVCVCRITPLCAHAQRCGVSELLALLLGVVQCFFGCYYAALIAVAETARLLAWHELARSYATLRANYHIAVEQNRKDNVRDADGNGVPDVCEMPLRALASHKLRLFVKSVDVDALEAAVRTLLACCFTVMATLRVRLARTIAIAHSMASLTKELVPLDVLLADALPPDLRKLAGLLSKLLFYVAALTLSSFMGHVVFMLYCALRGAHMVVSHTLHVAQLRPQWTAVAGVTVHSPAGRVAMATLALCGFVWQLLYHDHLPSRLRVLLLPLTLAEYLLQVFIYVFLYAAPLH